MRWKQQRHPLERAAVAATALSVGGAVAFAIFTLVPRTGNVLTIAALSGGLVAAFAVAAVLRRVGEPRRVDMRGFRIGDFVQAMGEPAPLEQWLDVDEPADGEAAMRHEEAGEDELLLDDPLPALDPDSRVVELFEPEQPGPLPEPGELVARIADYLGAGRGTARQAAASEPLRTDASVALHAALADIRRSLR